MIIHGEKLSRAYFKIEIIEDFKFSRDRFKRVAFVKYQTNDQKSTIIQRPINKLYPIETSVSETNETENCKLTFVDERNIHKMKD